jgi:uncharacterized protein YbaR (Trm112 family)
MFIDFLYIIGQKRGFMVEEEFFDLLVCPTDKSKLRGEKDFLICDRCKTKYLIKDDIFILLPKKDPNKF